MKKSVLLMAAFCLVLCQVSSGKVLLQDNFDTGGTAGALSRGWQFTLNEFVKETGVDFIVAPEWPEGQDGPGTDFTDSAGNPIINPPMADGTASSGGYLMSDSDAAGGSDDSGSMAEVWAISPSFNTTGVSQVWLHSDTDIESNNNGEALAILQASPDGGTTWIQVWVMVEPQRVIDTFNEGLDTKDRIGGWPVLGSASQTKSFDGIHGRWHVQLPAECINKTNVKFRIGWYESADAWWIAMDNIVIDDVPPPAGTETILSEDFENGIPATWSNTPAAGKTQIWGTTPLMDEFNEPLKWVSQLPINVDFVRNAALYEIEIDLDNPDPQFNPKGLTDGRWLLMLAGQGYAMWQEGPYAPADGVSESANLDTPSLNCSTATGVFLEFDSEMNAGNGSSVYDVYVSTDGGQNYSRIFTYQGALMDRDEGPYFMRHYLEVPSAAGKANVKFRFHGEGQDPVTGDITAGTNGTMSGFWVIDNVKVTVNRGTDVPEWSLY